MNHYKLRKHKHHNLELHMASHATTEHDFNQSPPFEQTFAVQLQKTIVKFI